MTPSIPHRSACLVCGYGKTLLRQVTRDYQLTECGRCGLVWDAGAATVDKSLYSEGYYHSVDPRHGYPDYLKSMSVNRLTFRRRLDQAEKRLGSKGRLLDVGCALGDCLLEAKNMGWEGACGLEISDFAVKVCGQRGVHALRGDLTDHPFQKGSFDLVLIQDVIEHVQDPVTHLREAQQLLRPGGLLLITTPNIKSLSARGLRSKWFHFKPGEHLTYFSPSSLQLAMLQAGFENLATHAARSTMALDYICHRLEYYSPSLFGLLSRWLGTLGLAKFPVSLRIGEIEGWAHRPSPDSFKNVIPLRRRG